MNVAEIDCFAQGNGKDKKILKSRDCIPDTNFNLDSGEKADLGKLRWHLMPFEELEDVTAILTFGAEKYSPDNWKKVPDAHNRYLSALFRHIVAYAEGKEKDAESGRHHLAHAICNCLFLMWFDRHGKKSEN